MTKCNTVDNTELLFKCFITLLNVLKGLSTIRSCFTAEKYHATLSFMLINYFKE